MFFQVDLLAQVNARIKTLEDAGNDVPAHLSKITSYGFRRAEDFDKYGALNMAEQLATAAKLSGHEKASTYDAIACTLREKLPFTEKQFNRILSLFWRIRSTQRFLKPWLKWISPLSLLSPCTASGSTGAPAHASARPPALWQCRAPGYSLTRPTWPSPVLPALPGHFLCRVHCAVKLNTGFSLSPGQASFLDVRSDTTNLSYLLMPLPTAGLEFLTQTLFPSLLLITGLKKFYRLIL